MRSSQLYDHVCVRGNVWTVLSAGRSERGKTLNGLTRVLRFLFSSWRSREDSSHSQSSVTRFIITTDPTVHVEHLNSVQRLLGDQHLSIIDNPTKSASLHNQDHQLSWKLCFNGGELIAARAYDQHQPVATMFDGSTAGHQALAGILRADLEVKLTEVDERGQQFYKDHFPELYANFLVPADQVSYMINDLVCCLDRNTYLRVVDGGLPVRRQLLGSIDVLTQNFVGEIKRYPFILQDCSNYHPSRCGSCKISMK